MNWKNWIVLSGIILVLPAYGQDALQRLRSVKGLEHAAIGISVKRTGDGKEVVAYAPQMALTPASVTKLLPTYLALKVKGSNFRYTTTVGYSGSVQEGVLNGNLIIRAVGDPCFDSRFFPEYSLIEQLLQKIEELKIREIKGRIIVVEDGHKADIPGSWVWEDISNYYGALYHAFNYRDNTYTLTFQSGKSGQLTRLTGIQPELPGIEFRNEVYASSRNKDNAWIFGGPYSSLLCVQGTIPANRQAFQVKGAMHHPAVIFENELKDKLVQRGIRIGNEMIPEDTFTSCMRTESPVLEKIVYSTNKFSVNLFAEALGSLAGQGNWTEKAGQLLKEAGVTTDGMVLKDACGLSVMDAVPAEIFTDLLVKAYEEKAFVRSLPVAGKDANLNGYCRHIPRLQGKCLAKTGSMSGVRCLAGYLRTDAGETLAFTILINHYTCSSLQLQQAVGSFLADFL